jgi:nucleotide-binding universal stress UspA family protein
VTPIQTILHPTDFSDRSENAFQLACALTRDYGARLVVVHVLITPTIARGVGVIPPDPAFLHQEALEQLNRLQPPHNLVRAERRLEEGDPATQILRVAREIGANLIVMGTHGRAGVRRLLMGSVAEQVVRKAPCAVLTVTAPFPGATPSGVSLEEAANV